MYNKKEIESVLIEITNVCNLKCKHCFNYDARDCGKDNCLSKDSVELIIRKCVPYGLEKVYISGGEPFTHPEIKEIIKLCEKYKEIQFVFTTNGLLLTEDLLIELEKHKNVCVQISVDGLKKESYESIRGENTFDTFLLVLHKLSMSKVKHLTARTCINRFNYREVSDIYKTMVDMKITPSFIYISRMGNAKDNWDDYSLNMAQRLWTINSINKMNCAELYYVNPIDPTSTCNFTEGKEIRSLYVKYTGEIAPCQYFYDYNIGNIIKDDVEDILCYEKMSKIYEIAKKRNDKLSNSECKKCEINSICGKGCLGLAQMAGDSLGVDGDCEFRLKSAASYSNGIICYSNKEEIVKSYSSKMIKNDIRG